MRPAPLLRVIAFASLACSLGIAGAADAPRVISVIPVTGPIGPATADFVQRALEQYRIRYPNAQDNDRRTWDLYGIRFWPSFVLIDKRGDIRYEGAGEFHLNDRNYRLWQHRIEELLAE